MAFPWKAVAIGLGAAGSIMIFAAQTPVEDARSNISGWLAEFGLNELAVRASGLSADIWATLTGGTLLIVAITIVVWRWRRSSHRSSARVVSMGAPLNAEPTAPSPHQQPLEQSTPGATAGADRAAAKAETPAYSSRPDDSQWRELVASWYRMVDEIDEATSSERGFDRLTKIRNELKRRSHYHRLAQYLPEDVQEYVNAPSGIRVVAALTVEGEETPDQALLKRLRYCIAGIEAEWGLLGPAQLTSSRNSRAPRA